ncbi:TPA: metal ABC transporter ATP-binding protein [Candidatus Bathyarchaeota archaeon]|nr:metal ABC transporter ATP-binding protein [Candidatus Bathyarchaeota archaeon]
MSVILLKNISTTYQGEKKPAIHDINLMVERGEFLCVVGPNGAGKTTLLETIVGCLKPVRGEVKVLGFNMASDGVKVRRKIGYTPQDFMAEPDEPYKALDVVLMGRFGKIGLLRGISREDVEKALKVMEMLDIHGLADKPIGKLSGGQQQKVMIARALAKEPEILLLDEPLSNLDYDSRMKISELLGEISRRQCITTLVVAHNPEHLLQFCQRVIVVSEGKIISDISSGELEREEAVRALAPSLKVELR